MKKYRVNVNGTEYEVGVELIGEGEIAKAPAAPKAAPAPAPAPAPAAPAKGEGTMVTAPMPGTILGVNIKDGDSVKRGQVLVILEAMKMENEIQAPCDGVVSGMSVGVGSTVEAGASICFVG